MQKCKICGITKTNDNYYKHKNREKSLFRTCKSCNREIKRKRNKIYLEKDKYIYIIKNKAWEGYLKIGSTINTETRLKSYQTGSPFRDYEIVFYIKTKHIFLIENHFKDNFKCSHEWVFLEEEEAIDIILNLINEESSKNRRQSKRNSKSF